MLLRLYVVASIFGCVFVANPQIMSACSCNETTQAEQFAWSDLVFRGSVTSIEDEDQGTVLVQFHAAIVWQGQSRHTVTLQTSRDEAGCGYPFEIGREYVVYSKEGGVSLCGFTSPVDDMEPRDFVPLGKGHSPMLDAGPHQKSVQEGQARVVEEEDRATSTVTDAQPSTPERDNTRSSRSEHNYWITAGAVAGAIVVTALLMRLRARHPAAQSASRS